MERAIAFPTGRWSEMSSTAAPRPSLGAPALRANSGKGESTWVASGFCATSTNVFFPHFAQQNCTRGRPTSCASGRECCAPQFEQAAFIGPCDSGPNLARLFPAGIGVTQGVALGELSFRTGAVGRAGPGGQGI